MNLQGQPNAKTERLSSALGFSMINIIFDDRVDVYFVRTRLLERLSTASSIVPSGDITPLGRDATGGGAASGRGESLEAPGGGAGAGGAGS